MNKTKLSIKNSLDELGKVREFTKNFCNETARIDESDQRFGLIELGISEITANIIKHGELESKESIIKLIARSNDQEIQFEFIDNGKEFDPESVPQPSFDGSRDNGFGLYIVNNIFDKVVFHNDEGENHTILTISF